MCTADPEHRADPGYKASHGLPSRWSHAVTPSVAACIQCWKICSHDFCCDKPNANVHENADLHANANRTVAHVGPPGCLHWVEVDVNDLVQVFGHLLRDLCQLVKVKVPAWRGSCSADLPSDVATYMYTVACTCLYLRTHLACWQALLSAMA